MPRITEERRAAQRARIVEAMRDAVREKGISSVSMSEVIERSGLSAGAIYGYFPSKDDILLAVAEGLAADRRTELERVIASTPIPPPSQVLRLLLTTIPEFARDGTLVLQVWAEAARDPRVGEVFVGVLSTLQTTMEEYLTSWFTQEQRPDPAADASASTRVMAALVQGFLAQSALLEQTDAVAFSRGVAALLGEETAEEG
ncbi:TetR/AcrR family transcriptional regulator [Brachybacterium halotolerans subsp. kimchii]|uniref:TetR/AcrR family transcriptional regulator n=1 Tax=Brachybacterium TaxID=43668 RepID=UPI001E449D41|nr:MULTISPECIES: TetR/AcrR family transcriptional regulator [Brachybacterium]MCG7309063.1 TetR/AcrR family transcriptional regulator [Brachybacterium sp. ACRRE]UEJ82026.1 TetR/AcrR family transcriptional regulator [Brachybacterium halotolerans subsp. kimchii]